MSFPILLIFSQNFLEFESIHTSMVSFWCLTVWWYLESCALCQLWWEVKSNWSITNCVLLMFLTPSFMKCYQTCQEMDILQVITRGPPKKQMSQFAESCVDPLGHAFRLIESVFSWLPSLMSGTPTFLKMSRNLFILHRYIERNSVHPSKIFFEKKTCRIVLISIWRNWNYSCIK